MDRFGRTSAAWNSTSVRGTVSSAVSGDGAVVAGNIYDGDPDRSVFTWTQSNGMKRLSGCGCVGFDTAADISFDGRVIVGRMAMTTGYDAYRWTSSTGAVDLGFLPGGSGESDAFGVSYDGSVVVGTSATNRYFQAFRWTQATGMVPIETPAVVGESSALAVSADGSVIVGYHGTPNGQEAVRWVVENGMTTSLDLGILPHGQHPSYASDVSGDGKVIVGGATGANGFEAFRWTQASGMQSIQTVLQRLGVSLSGWTLDYAHGVSADGSVIVGTGINPDGNSEGWIAVIPPTYVPEPTSLQLGLSAFLAWSVAFVVMRRRRATVS